MARYARRILIERPEVFMPGRRNPNIPARLLLGPGPSNAPERVLKAMNAPLLGHLHPEFIKIMDDVKDGLRYLFQTKNAPVVCCISGTGHAGMEAAIGNLLERDELLLIGKNGIWGERAQDIAGRMGVRTKVVDKPAGEAFSFEELEEAIRTHRPKALLLVQVESSTGVLQPIEGVGNLCQKYGTLLIVDTVASLGATPFFMDDWNVDVTYSGTQKVLGAPPSLAPIAFSSYAMEKVRQRKTPCPSFYFDIKHLSNYWGCDGEEQRRYHHTGPISSIYALREALALACEEGLEELWKRHEECVLLLHRHLKEMGLELFVEAADLRAPTITTVMVPAGVEWKTVCQSLVKRHHIEISGGLGPTASKVWRIGLMGMNSTPDNVRKVIDALNQVLKEDTTFLSRM